MPFTPSNYKKQHCSMLCILGAKNFWRSHIYTILTWHRWAATVYPACSMLPSDLELQYDQASTVLTFIQLLYSNIVDVFQISFVHGINDLRQSEMNPYDLSFEVELLLKRL
jgi:hypothetical protein